MKLSLKLGKIDMKYEQYKELVINNMPENPIPGLWQSKGAPRKHILGNPSTPEDRAKLINKYSLLPNVPPIDCKTIHLHQFAHHLNSSQIMCYNFFRPLMRSYDNNTHMYKPSSKLIKLVGELIGKSIETPLNEQDLECNFEYIQPNTDTTNFDFYIRCGEIEVFFEIKYTEKKFEKKKKTHKTASLYDNVYKDLICKSQWIFKGTTITCCDFYTDYQLSRNAIRAIDKNKYVVFVCPRAHKTLINQFNNFKSRHLNSNGEQQVKLISWEDIMDVADKLSIANSDFRDRYLSFLP